jgi:hypothetical protein
MDIIFLDIWNYEIQILIFKMKFDILDTYYIFFKLNKFKTQRWFLKFHFKNQN